MHVCQREEPTPWRQQDCSSYTQAGTNGVGPTRRTLIPRRSQQQVRLHKHSVSVFVSSCLTYARLSSRLGAPPATYDLFQDNF